MGELHATALLRSVRSKLLILLAALSLPLLIVGLYQLNSHRRTQSEQAANLIRIETTAAAGTLASWLEAHPDAQDNQIADEEARSLYAHVAQSVSSDSVSALAIYDSKGALIKNPSGNSLSSPLEHSQASIEQRLWSDGVTRLTGTRRVEPVGWSVAVGLPLKHNLLSSESILVLAATWALVLIASIFLGVWAVGRFTKPLLKLAATVSNLGEGHLHERVAVETDDEVGELAQRFNSMAAHLETKFSELQIQGAFIEEVLDGLPLGVVVLDSNLMVHRANAAFAGFIGRAPDALKYRGLYEAAAGFAVLSDVVEDVRRTRRPFVTYGLPLNLIARTQGDGEETDAQSAWDVAIWPMSERSATRGDLILVISEVSKRVRAERLATSAFALERMRAAELESVITQMSEGVIIIDRQRRYKINPAAASIIGRKPEDFRDGAEALMEDIQLLGADGNKAAVEATPLWRALMRRELVGLEQWKIAHADGSTRVVSISATPLTGEDSKPEGAVAVFRDITEGVLSHEELVAAYDRLREHDRLKSAFVTNISHELRTPLNVIIGLSQLLERDRRLPLADLQREAVVRMERNARSLLEMVNDLLDYSRLEAGRAALHLEKIGVGEIVNEVIADYAAEIKEKHVEISAEVAPELSPVLTDRHKLSQVLSNLVGNAIKFTTEGSITIKAAPVDEQFWYMEVSDTGIGMTREALGYIFEEFRQVDDRLARTYGGTGLGLAITKKIVELLEGEISVESLPSKGSSFRITWPRAVRQRTGTGSLVEKAVPEPSRSFYQVR
ncbi:MAG TPA: ATP-binding protein [Pyrinomonadaceae bacterium]|nr:ATP-binding protein [Pyrinomonadaceae bacterium]